MGITIVTDIINLIMALFLVFASVKMVLMTEKTLDVVSKFFLTASIFLCLGALAEVYSYFANKNSDIFFAAGNIVYTMAVIFFTIGFMILYGILKSERAEEEGNLKN